MLQALCELIGCSTVDVVRLTPEIDMWVDDEGLLEARPGINQLASYVATWFGRPYQLYVGTVVFSGGVDQAGNTATHCTGPPGAAGPSRGVAQYSGELITRLTRTSAPRWRRCAGRKSGLFCG